MPALTRVGAIYRSGRTNDPSVQRFGEIGQPCGLIDSVTNDGVFVAVFGADVSGEDGSGRNAYPEIDHG